MELGLLLNSQAPPESDGSAILDHLLDQTRAARDAGFDAVIAPQHYLTDLTQFQPWPLLGRAAAEAGGMRIGNGVCLLPLHHPVEVAENVATLDAMTDRPVIAGVATGYRDVEFESFGVPKSERGGRMEEGVRLLRRLWTGEDVVFDGEFYSVDGVTINPRPSDEPRLWIGANAGPAIDRAARLADAWYVNPHSTISEIAEQKAVYDERRAERGEDTRVPMRRELFVSRDEDVLEEVREHLAFKYRRYAEWGQDEAMEGEADLAGAFESLAEDRFVLGAPEEVCAELERYERELDVDLVVARVHFPGMEYGPALDCIERLGDEVVPHV